MDESFVSQLVALAELKEKGMLSEEEFQLIKNKVLTPDVPTGKRVIDKQLQLNYICEQLPGIIASLGVVSDGIAELYYLTVGGRKKNTIKSVDNLMEYGFKREWAKMQERTTREQMTDEVDEE